MVAVVVALVVDVVRVTDFVVVVVWLLVTVPAVVAAAAYMV